VGYLSDMCQNRSVVTRATCGTAERRLGAEHWLGGRGDAARALRPAAELAGHSYLRGGIRGAAERVKQCLVQHGVEAIHGEPAWPRAVESFVPGPVYFLWRLTGEIHRGWCTNDSTALV
jgi:hypothetical protein